VVTQPVRPSPRPQVVQGGHPDSDVRLGSTAAPRPVARSNPAEPRSASHPPRARRAHRRRNRRRGRAEPRRAPAFRRRTRGGPRRTRLRGPVVGSGRIAALAHAGGAGGVKVHGGFPAHRATRGVPHREDLVRRRRRFDGCETARAFRAGSVTTAIGVLVFGQCVQLRGGQAGVGEETPACRTSAGGGPCDHGERVGQAHPHRASGATGETAGDAVGGSSQVGVSRPLARPGSTARGRCAATRQSDHVTSCS
jgi:hypothetical protein